MHILHDNTLTQDNRDKFSYVAGRYGQLVEFHNVEELCADKIAKMIEMIPLAKTSRLSVAALYRLLIPQLLAADVDKCIWLDSDIIVNLDIKELWRIELGDKFLAAVTEISNDSSAINVINLCRDALVEKENYFNTGVLLMKLSTLHEKQHILMEGINVIGSNPEYGLLDQDVLNYCFSTQVLKLSLKFNRFTVWARRHHEMNVAEKIYHFAGMGLGMNIDDPFNRLWMRYFAQTPWFDEETIGRLYAGVQQMHVGFKQSMANLTAIMSGKTRGFFVAPPNVDAFKKLFSVRDDEEVITADSQESLIKLLDVMKRNHGKKLFFIMLPNFPFQILTQAGFAPGKDFVNGMDFLSEAQGFPLNSYPLLQTM